MISPFINFRTYYAYMMLQIWVFIYFDPYCFLISKLNARYFLRGNAVGHSTVLSGIQQRTFLNGSANISLQRPVGVIKCYSQIRKT